MLATDSFVQMNERRALAFADFGQSPSVPRSKPLPQLHSLSQEDLEVYFSEDYEEREVRGK